MSLIATGAIERRNNRSGLAFSFHALPYAVGKEEDMATHFDPKEVRPVKYPGEENYPQKSEDDTVVPETESRHLNRGQYVIMILIAIMAAVVLIWGGAEWLFGTPTVEQ